MDFEVWTWYVKSLYAGIDPQRSFERHKLRLEIEKKKFNQHRLATPKGWGERLRARLRHAAESGDVPHVEALLMSAEADHVGWRYCGGREALRAAAEAGRDEVVSLMLRCYSQARNRLDAGIGSKKWSILQFAAKGGHLPVMKMLVDAGASVDFIDAEGRSALHLAVSGNYTRLVEWLLAVGAPPSPQDSKGIAPVHIAVENAGDMEIIAALQLHGAIDSLDDKGKSLLNLEDPPRRPFAIDIFDTANPHPNEHIVQCRLLLLVQSAKNGEMNVLRMLLRVGLDPNFLACDELSPLHHAAAANQVDAVRLLLDSGATVDLSGSRGETPLCFAAANGSFQGAVALLNRGANVNAQDSRGVSPLMRACSTLNENLANLFVQRGADESIVDNQGLSAHLYLERRAEARGELFFGDRIRRMRILLFNTAPAERAWRRRGWLVMHRARAIESGARLHREGGRRSLRQGCSHRNGLAAARGVRRHISNRSRTPRPQTKVPARGKADVRRLPGRLEIRDVTAGGSREKKEARVDKDSANADRESDASVETEGAEALRPPADQELFDQHVWMGEEGLFRTVVMFL